MKITSNTKLSKVFKKKTLVNVLSKFNVPCVSCPIAKHEIEQLSVGYVCDIYGIDKKELIKELNKKAKKY